MEGIKRKYEREAVEKWGKMEVGRREEREERRKRREWKKRMREEGRVKRGRGTG